MGLVSAIIIALIGFTLAFVLNSMPAESVSKFIPICWIPGADCPNRYHNIKLYIFLILIVLCVWVIPF